MRRQARAGLAAAAHQVVSRHPRLQERLTSRPAFVFIRVHSWLNGMDAAKGLPERTWSWMFLVLLSFLLLCPPGALAVDYPLRWRWSNPTPHGNNINDMAYSFPLLLAVQVADRGQIYTSDNLDLWIHRDSGTTDLLLGVTFFGSRILVAGEKGRVLYADSVDAFTNGTLLDGATSDWLEAVAASPRLAVAVGDNGAIYTSTNGAAWKRQATTITTWLRGVAFGAGTFVAVGEDGFIATSLNGTNWTRRTSGTTLDLNRVICANNVRFLAVGTNGLTLTSTNAGVSWFQETCGATNQLFNTITGNGDRLVVGDYEVRVQNNTNTVWSNELAKTNGPVAWTYYANIGRPDLFFIGGRTGVMAEGTKPDLISYSWQRLAESVRNWLWDVTYVDGLYVAVGDFRTIMTSGNGVNWVLEVPPAGLTNAIFLGVGGTADLLVAAGDQGTLIISPNATLTNTILTGTNQPITSVSSAIGVIWHAVPSGTTKDLQGVAFFNGLYVVTGEGGIVLTSPDGTNWTRRATPTTNMLTSVTAWTNGLVAVGDDGTIITSPTGINWTLRAVDTTNWLYRVRYLDGKLVAVGQNGTIFYSLDGVNWDPRTSGTTKWLHDLTYIDDTWFIVGREGVVLTSTNRHNWTNIGTITRKDLYSVATDSRQLVTVGWEGLILRSQILPDLTPIQILSYDRVVTTNLVGQQNLFLFGGKTDQQFTLDYSRELGTNLWTSGSQLEIFDSDGTLYYVETLYGTNLPVREFYRATVTP